MRHFEKPAGARFFKRLNQKGSLLTLVVGQAAGGAMKIVEKFRSSANAQQALSAWAQLLKNDGFGEVPLTSTTLLGRVVYTKSPKGPGRIHSDEGDNVYFGPASLGRMTVKYGDRIFLDEVFNNKKRREVFMLGSKLETKKVSPFPKMLRTMKGERKEVRQKDRTTLLKKIGPLINGHQFHKIELNKARCGDLIFAWEKGIHRFLKLGRLDRLPVVFYETVLTSKLDYRLSPILCCTPKACMAVPQKLLKEINKHFPFLRPWDLKE